MRFTGRAWMAPTSTRRPRSREELNRPSRAVHRVLSASCRAKVRRCYSRDTPPQAHDGQRIRHVRSGQHELPVARRSRHGRGASSESVPMCWMRKLGRCRLRRTGDGRSVEGASGAPERTAALLQARPGSSWPANRGRWGALPHRGLRSNRREAADRGEHVRVEVESW